MTYSPRGEREPVKDRRPGIYGGNAMKRTKFYIYIYDAAKKQSRPEQVNGYAETINGLPIGIHKNKEGTWTVSELSTGLKFTQGRTRAEAMESAREWLDQVATWIAQDKFKKAREAISAAYGI